MLTSMTTPRDAIQRSQPAKDTLQPLDISEDPWRNIGMGYFNGVCNYFSKFPFMLKAEISFWYLRDHLIDLFAVEGHLEIVDNGDNDPYLKVLTPFHHLITQDQMAS